LAFPSQVIGPVRLCWSKLC